MATVTKTPYEKLPLSWDFSADLGQGETITLTSVTAAAFLSGADSTAAVVAATPGPGVTGSVVTFWVQGGTAGQKHELSVKVSTSQGQQLEGTIHLEIVAGK